MEKVLLDGYKAGYELFISADKKINNIKKYLDGNTKTDLIKSFDQNFDPKRDYEEIVRLGSEISPRSVMSRKLSELYHQQEIGLNLMKTAVDTKISNNGDQDTNNFRDELSKEIVKVILDRGEITDEEFLDLTQRLIQKHIK